MGMVWPRPNCSQKAVESSSQPRCVNCPDKLVELHLLIEALRRRDDVALNAASNVPSDLASSADPAPFGATELAVKLWRNARLVWRYRMTIG